MLFNNNLLLSVAAGAKNATALNRKLKWTRCCARRVRSVCGSLAGETAVSARLSTRSRRSSGVAVLENECENKYYRRNVFFLFLQICFYKTRVQTERNSVSFGKKEKTVGSRRRPVEAIKIEKTVLRYRKIT